MNAIYVYYTYIMISWFQMGNMRHIQLEKIEKRNDRNTKWVTMAERERQKKKCSIEKKRNKNEVVKKKKTYY